MEMITLCGLVIVAVGLWIELEPVVMAVIKMASKNNRAALLRTYFSLILHKSLCYKAPLFNSHASVDPVVSLFK